MLKVNDIKPGSKVALVGGVVGEVVENMGDGEWLLVRYVKVSNGEAGVEELCHAQDVVGLISDDGAL